MDYYQALGVSKDASDEEIKKAYKRKALEYHPDVYKGENPEEAVNIFKKAVEAYEVLSDPAKRSQYDVRGYAGRRPRHQNYYHPNSKPKPQKPKAKAKEPHNEQKPKSEDGLAYTYMERRGMGRSVQVQVKLTPELKRGGKHLIKVKKRPECGNCLGEGEKMVRCPKCNAAKPEVNWCPTCDGVGGIYQQCKVCKGDGVSPNYVFTEVQVVVPPNCPSGHMVQVIGEGESGKSRQTPGNVQIIFI